MAESSKIKNTAKIVILASCLLAGIYFYKFYQPETKSIKLYEQGLNNFQNGNYQNSYYLFSKIGYFAKLKPAALYRQALCAKTLGDKYSEYKSYRHIFKYYPNNILSNESKYYAAQILIDRDSETAKKYFKQIVHSDAEQDYKIASAYYIAKIDADKIIKTKIKPDKEKLSKIEKAFRNYLIKYPDGRLAQDVAYKWIEFNPKTNSKDSTIIAKTLYLSGNYKKAEETLSKTKINDSWAIQALNSFALNDIEKGTSLTIEGITKLDKNIPAKDYNLALIQTLKHSPNPYATASSLLSHTNGENKQYLWYKKCSLAPQKDRTACFNELYSNYPDGKYSKHALENLFNTALESKNYKLAKQIEEDYIIRFPESENAAQMMFWRAKLEQRYFYNPNFQIFFRNIINNYPDTYYAYRSFWILQGFNTSVISTGINSKNIEYPYRYPAKNDILHNMILVRDYEMIKKLTDDGFIQSWALYQQGKYTESMNSAKVAMDKLKTKPPKTDVRWRLVYPLNFYKQVKNNANTYNNNEALIMSILREESSFNPEAQSAVGAIGLMQLMPATAHDIGINNSLQFNTRDLFNPELNIKLGNIYFSSLTKQFEGTTLKEKSVTNVPHFDKYMLSVASYNGGIGSVQRWQNNIKTSDFDEFVKKTLI